MLRRLPTKLDLVAYAAVAVSAICVLLPASPVAGSGGPQDEQPGDGTWWSLRALKQPALPALTPADSAWIRTPIDRFIAATHRKRGLRPAPVAGRPTLIRRLYFDLIGLPPTPQEIDAFVADADPRAYEKLVDRLLASPHYGERWARHWLDVVHYGDTHGYDKDKPRPNAWPYRDYVIRSLNADKPYGRFVKEQIAGDVLYPDDPAALAALGFIAAGPWDFISHVEVPETKLDGRIARHLDRDDMVRTTMETFTSVTVGCARCHDHKFDPITQEDYYSLQAVFAAVDRADRPYDADPAVFARRKALTARYREMQQSKEGLDAAVRKLARAELAKIDEQIAAADQQAKQARPEFGYHSAIESKPDRVKWVQVDLGKATAIAQIVLVGCHDDFNNIGAGFGFPVRFRVEVSDDPECKQGATCLADHTESDVANPGVEPQRFPVSPEGDRVTRARYVRVTATKLAPRMDDYIFALAELAVHTASGANVARGATVTALDSIEAPVRWQKSNLVDGFYLGVGQSPQAKARREELEQQREALLDRVLSAELKQSLQRVQRELHETTAALGKLPKPTMVYAAATQFAVQGNFTPTGGMPRMIHVLHRGNLQSPGAVAHAGALPAITTLPARFDLTDQDTEGDRRAALAQWIAHPQNPLSWRSIVNRVWQYHFGRGLVETPDDFGRMGQLPSHPQLLDWLAAEFRDANQSLKELHRIICNSATYRQSSSADPAFAEIDRDNRFLWRMNRRRLEAEVLRDAVLAVSGKLDRRMFGPGFQDFVVDKPEHSPHYKYRLHDPEDPRCHRRAIYRFLVRSQQEPFMTAMDCADPSMRVDKRNETLSAVQALAMLNNKLVVAMSRHFAARVASSAQSLPEQVAYAFRLATGRQPTDAELAPLVPYAKRFGLPNACRVILNLNEFVFVD